MTVPRIDPDYTQDVATWWRLHPYNPANPTITIAHPTPSVDASTFGGSGTSGDPYDLQAAVDSLSSGGTLTCPTGIYDRADVTGKSNIHFLGVTGTTFRAVNLNGGALITSKTYSTFSAAIKMQQAASIAQLRNPPSNFYFNNVVFDANGRIPTIDPRGTPDYVALGTYGVRDVLLDNCVLQNVGRNPFGSALVFAIGGIANLWFRNCTLHGSGGSIANNPEEVVEINGCRGGGMLNCTIDGFFTSPPAWNCDEDLTVDLDGDGVLSRDDMRDNRYIVLSGVNSSGDIKNFAEIEGYSNLIENCTQSVHVNSFLRHQSRNLDDWSQTPPGSGDWRGGYVFTNSVVRNNTVISVNDGLVVLDGTWIAAATSPEGTPAGGQNALGLMNVAANTIQHFGGPALKIIQVNQAISTPCIVQGNSPNDNVVGGSIRADANVAWALSDEGPNWGADRPPVRSSFI